MIYFGSSQDFDRCENPTLFSLSLPSFLKIFIENHLSSVCRGRANVVHSTLALLIPRAIGYAKLRFNSRVSKSHEASNPEETFNRSKPLIRTRSARQLYLWQHHEVM